MTNIGRRFLVALRMVNHGHEFCSCLEQRKERRKKRKDDAEVRLHGVFMIILSYSQILPRCSMCGSGSVISHLHNFHNVFDGAPGNKVAEVYMLVFCHVGHGKYPD